jgi:hypothetical protein
LMVYDMTSLLGYWEPDAPLVLEIAT